MKNWIINNKLYFIGTFIGALAGFLYWKYVGCLTGTCSITSNPINSTIYFALISGLLYTAILKKKGYAQFFISKLKFVVLPYLFFTLFYSIFDDKSQDFFVLHSHHTAPMP